MKSGVQRQVLLLYKDFLKEISLKEFDSQKRFKEYIRSEFKRNLEIPKNEFNTIEYLIR